MVALSTGSVDSWTNSSPLRSSSKPSVRNVSAGWTSFSRNHAEQAFSVCRISRTLSRARRIFCPVFPMVVNPSCTRSLGVGHPMGVKLAGLHGFTDGPLTGGVSQGALTSPVAGVAAYEAETALPESPVQGARPRGRLASGRGSAACRMNLTACGNASVAERHDIKKRATAGMLLEAEYIFLSRPNL